MDVPSPEMRRVLRQARLYGHLQSRDGRVFHPGANKPLCREMACAAWLKRDGDRYVIRPEIASAEAQD